MTQVFAIKVIITSLMMTCIFILPCCGSVSHDVATDRFLGIRRKHGSSIDLGHNLQKKKIMVILNQILDGLFLSKIVFNSLNSK
jgi:hypothetical protein